jgi:excisionase family DNA binding protein
MSTHTQSHPTPDNHPDRTTRLLTVAEVADMLAVSEQTVWRLADAGLPRVRVGPAGRSVRFLLADVEALVERGRTDEPRNSETPEGIEGSAERTTADDGRRLVRA